MKKKELKKLLQSREAEIESLHHLLAAAERDLKQLALHPDTFEAINIVSSMKHFHDMERAIWAGSPTSGAAKYQYVPPRHL